MISIIIRDLPYLKILHPICMELHRKGVEYIIYHWDAYRGEKAYNNASLANIKKSSPGPIKHAKKIQVFNNDKQLRHYLLRDKIKKFVSIEISLWGKSYLKFFKSNKIKTYSILYLSDSMWNDSTNGIDKVYYTTKHLMETYHSFSGVKYDKNRDRSFGSPIFNSLTPNNNGKDILVLLPNTRKDRVNILFGSEDNFIKIIAKLAEGGDLIFKSRQKQWLPNKILPYAKKIVYDGDKMYPSVMSGLFNQSYTTVMFFSSGIYECVCGGNYVANIILPDKRSRWDKTKVRRYYLTQPNNLYQFSGVVESISQSDILQSGWEFNPQKINKEKRKKWVKRFIGPSKDSSRLIAEDIMKG